MALSQLSEPRACIPADDLSSPIRELSSPFYRRKLKLREASISGFLTLLLRNSATCQMPGRAILRTKALPKHFLLCGSPLAEARLVHPLPTLLPPPQLPPTPPTWQTLVEPSVTRQILHLVTGEEEGNRAMAQRLLLTSPPLSPGGSGQRLPSPLVAGLGGWGPV